MSAFAKGAFEAQLSPQIRASRLRFYPGPESRICVPDGSAGLHVSLLAWSVFSARLSSLFAKDLSTQPHFYPVLANV
jgi:hypothetical protein